MSPYQTYLMQQSIHAIGLKSSLPTIDTGTFVVTLLFKNAVLHGNVFVHTLELTGCASHSFGSDLNGVCIRLCTESKLSDCRGHFQRKIADTITR